MVKLKTPKADSLIRASTLIFLFLIGAKLLNFVKKILIGKFFGVSSLADAFFAASYLPYYLAIFFEGVIFLGFLPIFAQEMKERGKEEAAGFVTEVFVLVLAATSVLAAAAWWKSSWIIHQLVPGFKPAEMALACSLFRVLALVLILISLTSFFKALNSYFGDYASAASSGLVDAAVMTLVLLAAWKAAGIYAAAWGAVAGAGIALATQAFFLYRKHLVLVTRIKGLTPRSLGLFYFFLPVSVIWLFQQVPFVILNRFGSGMWQGTISALTISHTLTTVPMGLVSHTVLFAVFPAFARHAGGNDTERLRETFFQTLRAGFLVLIPVGLLLSVLARPLAVLFFEGGGISPEGTKRVANSLACFGWATFALYADLFMTQSSISVRKTRPAIVLCATRAALTYGIGYFFSTWWDYQGLAQSFSLALVLNLVLFFPVFLRDSPFDGKWKDLFSLTAQAAIAGAPIALAGALLNRWSVDRWLAFPKPVSLGLALLAGLAGGALYLILLYGMKVPELYGIKERLSQGWLRKDWTVTEERV